MQQPNTEQSQENRCFLYFLRALKVFSVISMLLNITTYVLVTKAVTESHNIDDLEKTYVTLSMIGYMAFSLILIVAEFDPPVFMQFVMVFHYWAGRGFGMVWLAIQTLAQTKAFAQTAGSEEGISAGVLEAFGAVAGWIIFSIGVLYIIFSALCLRRCLGENSGELEVQLVPKGTGSGADTVTNTVVQHAAVNVPAGSNMADAMLIANMSVALGMTPAQAKEQFSGKHGGSNARDHAKKNGEAMGKAAAAGAMSHVKAQPGMQNALVVGDAVTTHAAAHIQSNNMAEADDVDIRGGGGKGGGNDDDELERAYYASMQ